MANDPKILGEGQVAAATTAIYTCPAATKAIIRTVSFNHVAGAIQTVNLWVKKSGSSLRRFSRAVLDVNEFAHEEDIGTLDAGDALHADSTNAASVDYTVHGIEQT